MRAILFSFIFLIAGTARAQETDTWGTITRTIPAKPYAGKNFMVQVAAKIHPLSKDAKAGMYVSVRNENKKPGFYKNMSDSPITASEWQLYRLSGKIDKKAMYLTVGLGYSDPGIFYFDDFRLFVEDSAGNMQQVPLVNGDFEEDSVQSKYSWYCVNRGNAYTLSICKDDFFSGKHSFKADGSALGSLKTYGNNDTAGHYAAVNGVKLYYEIYGQGAPLLLLHGNSSSIKTFEKQIPELARYFKVLAVDTRGQGKSSEDGKLYTYDLFAEDMNALLNELHLDSVNIAGWSDGGNTGLIMAMKYPQKVKKLVTMGANVFIDKSVVEKWVFKSLQKEKQELSASASYNDKNRCRLITLLLTEPRHSFAELGTITCPVLVMAGEKDLIKEAHTKAVAAGIRNSTLRIVPKATHYFPVEDPGAFNKAVIDFFNE